MNILRSYLSFVTMGLMAVSSANVVVCAERTGAVAVRLASHDCHAGMTDMVHSTHSSTPCSGDCHFHAPECCQDTPLSFSPAPIEKPTLTAILSVETGIGVMPDSSLARIPSCDAYQDANSHFLSSTILRI